MNEMGTRLRPVDDTLAVPLYHQVYLVLRENIRTGVYAPGSSLPSESALCDQFAVSRITVKRAMRELSADGLVVRQRGRGTFVAEMETTSAKPDALDDLIQSVRAIGEATEVREVSSADVSAGPDVASRLNLKPGDAAFKTTQLRVTNDEPLAVITAYVPTDIGARLDPTSANQPMLVRLRLAGVPVTRADQEVTATIADPTTAGQLGIGVGAPLLKLTRLVFDDTGRPVEWLTALYRGDRYAVRTSLTHDDSGRQSAWRPAAE